MTSIWLPDVWEVWSTETGTLVAKFDSEGEASRYVALRKEQTKAGDQQGGGSLVVRHRERRWEDINESHLWG
jgi:hypothetical protein